MGTVNVTVEKPTADQVFELGELVQNCYGTIFLVGEAYEGCAVKKVATVLKPGMQAYVPGQVFDIEKLDHSVRVHVKVTLDSTK